jgi:hypothetical protein
MDFDNFQDSPTLLQNSNLNSKRKRQEASETPVSYSKRKRIKIQEPFKQFIFMQVVFSFVI